MTILNAVRQVMRFFRRRVCGHTSPDARELPFGAGLTYSQAGEDRILGFLFGSLGIHCPSYIDIGAHDPKLINSTYLFYSNGSRGVCVEPNPEFAAKLKDQRPDDVVVEAGIVPVSGESLKYHMFQETTYNTFASDEAMIRAQHGGDGGRLLRTVDVTTLTLDELMLKYRPQGVDLLAIDVEGLDETIVVESKLSIRPKLIMVETVPFSGRHPVRKSMGIVEKLAAKGYKLVADTYVNTIFIDEALLSTAENRPAEQSQPNGSDRFPDEER